MRLINTYEIDNKERYVSIEIFHGDLTALENRVDLLIVSAFKGGYNPVKSTLLGALYDNLDINIKHLSKVPTIDLRKALNCWYTDDFNSDMYKAIMVLEMRENNISIPYNMETIFKNMFIALSVLEQKGIIIKTIALPPLGTGLQNVDLKEVIDALINNLKKSLSTNNSIERIMFVEYNSEKADVLSEKLDTILNRVKVELPVNEIIIDVKKQILKSVKNNKSKSFLESSSYKYLIETFNNENSKSYNYGIVSRRLVEKLLTEKYFESEEYKYYSFFKKIQELNEMQVANWIVSYLHVIRIFGNESAHDFSNKTRYPNSISSKDVSLLLFCVQRVVEFLVTDDE